MKQGAGLELIKQQLYSILVGEAENYEFMNDPELKKGKIITICVAHAVFKTLLQAKQHFEANLQP